MALVDLSFTITEAETVAPTVSVLRALPLTTMVSQSSSKNRTYRVLKSQFGNGYAQMIPDGINNKIDSWNLVWNNLTLAQRNTLWTFIDTVGASSEWVWMAFGDTTEKYWTIDSDVIETAQSGETYSISFTAKQAF